MSNNPSTIPHGNTSGTWVIAVALTPISVANATAAEQTFTVSGLHLGDCVTVNKPTNQAGLGIAGTRVSAKDTLAINFVNATSATITPTAAETYTISVMRPENLNASSVSNLGTPF